MNEKYCVHKYLTPSESLHPAGFADFLRGTIVLYNYSKIYNYKLYINNSHPIFKYLKPNEKIISNNLNTKEYVSPMNMNIIDSKVKKNFESGHSFSIMTNGFYKRVNGELTNYGPIPYDCKLFLKDILSPSIHVENNINYVFDNFYNFNLNDSYKVIHLRIGDNFINSGLNDNKLYTHYYSHIYNLINRNKNIKYVLVTDANKMGNKLKENIPELYYWDNSKTHLGFLNNNEEKSIIDTLTDLFIISKCNEIIANVPLRPFVSGFSTVISEIYDIKYTFFANLPQTSNHCKKDSGSMPQSRRICRQESSQVAPVQPVSRRM